jgi:hypothetical protein
LEFRTPHREGLLPHTELQYPFLVSRRPPSFLIKSQSTPLCCFVVEMYAEDIFFCREEWTFSILFNGEIPVSFSSGPRVLRNVQAKSCKFSAYENPTTSIRYLTPPPLSQPHLKTLAPPFLPSMTSINLEPTSTPPKPNLLAQPHLDPHIPFRHHGPSLHTRSASISNSNSNLASSASNHIPPDIA